MIDPETIKQGDVCYADRKRCVVQLVRRYKTTKRATVGFDDGKRATFEAGGKEPDWHWREVGNHYTSRELVTPEEHDGQCQCVALMTPLRTAADQALYRTLHKNLTKDQMDTLAEILKCFARPKGNDQ